MSTETWQAFLMVVISDSSLAAMHKARAADTSLLVNLAPDKDSLSEKNREHQQQAYNITQVARRDYKIYSKFPIDKPNESAVKVTQLKILCSLGSDLSLDCSNKPLSLKISAD